MRQGYKIEVVVKDCSGEFCIPVDSFEMELHDGIDHLFYKYVTKGSKWWKKMQMVPTKFLTEMSREEERIQREKTV